MKEMKEFLYVLQHKTVSVKATGKVLLNEIYLIGYNLNEQEKNEKFYCFGKNEKHQSSSIRFDEDDKTIEIQNSYGCHSKKYKNDKEAHKFLITIPDEFNNALAVIKKYGFEVVPKTKIVSYQQAVGL